MSSAFLLPSDFYDLLLEGRDLGIMGCPSVCFCPKALHGFLQHFNHLCVWVSEGWRLLGKIWRVRASGSTRPPLPSAPNLRFLLHHLLPAAPAFHTLVVNWVLGEKDGMTDKRKLLDMKKGETVSISQARVQPTALNYPWLNNGHMTTPWRSSCKPTWPLSCCISRLILHSGAGSAGVSSHLHSVPCKLKLSWLRSSICLQSFLSCSSETAAHLSIGIPGHHRLAIIGVPYPPILDPPTWAPTKPPPQPRAIAAQRVQQRLLGNCCGLQ